MRVLIFKYDDSEVTNDMWRFCPSWIEINISSRANKEQFFKSGFRCMSDGFDLPKVKNRV